MEKNQGEGIFKKGVLKVIVPMCIMIAIGGIWFIKNSKEKLVAERVVTVGESTVEEKDFELHVTETLDLEQLKSYGLPIMIDFGADSCIPCKEMAPVLEKLNKELQGKAIIKFVDVWKYQILAEGYPLRVIPTQIFFDKEGRPYTPSDPQASQMNMYSLKETGEHGLTTHEGGMTEEMIVTVLKEMGLEE